MMKGEFEGAVGEFERFLHFFPEDKRVPEARYFIGLSYLMAGRFEKARNALTDVYERYPGQPVAYRSLFMIGESYYRQGAFEEAERRFQSVVRQATDAATVDAAMYRLGWTRLYQDRWGEASGAFGEIRQQSSLYASSQQLYAKSLEGESLPSKDPATAGVLAGIVPGLGHVYCDRYRDGLIAFLVNGLFIWAAVEAFDEDVDVLGGILLFMEAGWYAGNIYSAVNSAHKYNKRVRDQYRKGLKDALDISLLATKQGHVGVAFQIPF
jgi:outer membrane protein assembly factor BamD (BamD/ComL family)